MKRSKDVRDAGRCSEQSSKRSYGLKKKRFAGNRYTKAKRNVATHQDGTPVTINKKIKRIKRKKTTNLEGYRDHKSPGL